MSTHSIICAVAAMATLAPTLHATDRSGELSEVERNALAHGNTQGAAFALHKTQNKQKSLTKFDLKRIHPAALSELLNIVLPLIEGQQIDSALDVIKALPAETSAQVLVVALSPTRLALLSPMDTDAVVRMLITHEALLVALTEASPQSIACLLVHANSKTTTAFLATLADISVRSNFDAQRLFSTLLIKRLLPGFIDLNPESHFGARLRELKARIITLYREALQGISTKNGSPDER